MLDTLILFFSAGIGAVIRAILILILAFIVATVVKALVNKLLSTKKISEVLNKSGAGQAPAEFIGKLVYLLVFLLFVPGIFSSLGMDTVSAPILNLLNTMWGYLPNVVAACIILWVGFFIAKLVRELLIPVFNKLRVN